MLASEIPSVPAGLVQSVSSKDNFDWNPGKLRVASVHRSKGNSFFKHKAYDRAKSLYDRALWVLPPLVDARSTRHATEISNFILACVSNRCMCSLKLEQYATARRDATFVLDYDPSHKKALYRLVLALQGMGHLSAAIQAADTAVDQCPSLAKRLMPLRQQLQGQVEGERHDSMDMATPGALAPNEFLVIEANALYQVCTFLAVSDLGRLRAVCRAVAPACDSDQVWKDRLRSSFSPCFQGAVLSQASEVPSLPWKSFFHSFWSGQRSIYAQVMNRETERNLEFAMSAYNAAVTYRRELGSYHARYFPDGRGVVCETIKTEQIRAIPGALTSDIPSEQLFRDETLSNESFCVGDGVEIQWKRQPNHPFGWWFGLVESVWTDTKPETGRVGDVLHVQVPGTATSTPVLIEEKSNPDGENTADASNAPMLTKITVKFTQYVEDSPWYRVTVVLGTKNVVRSMGGYVGGIRLAAPANATKAERRRAKKTWQKFLPSSKIM